jgi:hypothetical protein
MLLLQGAAPAGRRGSDTQAAASVENLRRSGDLSAQRRHVWAVFAGLVTDEKPDFALWPGEGSLFGAASAARGPRGIEGFLRPKGTGGDHRSIGAPVIAYTLYNPTAFAHIRDHGLYQEAVLDRLRLVGKNATVPPFPATAMVIKTAWWPVAAEGLTAMPVWDPELNPPARSGNSYPGWARVVAVDPTNASLGKTAAVQFIGRSFPRARRVRLEALHHVAVDAAMAKQMAQDPESNRTAIMALGRPIAVNDRLALVGINMMTREQHDWVWAAFWWHDRPEVGPFAADRPSALRGPWHNYLMQAAFDAETPRASDGGARICFNPWLEGRFPEGGQGGGTVSNCMSCHQRATYPAAPFLPVTRGAPNQREDPALAPDRLRTSFLWSLALHAQRD